MAARPIFVISILCCAITAYASPRTDPTMGRSVFTGATLAHPTSILLNPAALGLGFNAEVYVALSGVLDYYAIDLQTEDAVSGTELGAGGMIAGIYRPTGSRYAVSFELRTPPPELFPQDHEELRYFTLGQRQRDFLGSIASTIRITNRLYFGATLTHHNTFLRLRYARDAAASEGEDTIQRPESDEIYNVGVRSALVSTSNLKATLGLLIRIYKSIWLGVAYHTPPGFNIQSELSGDVSIIRAPRDGGGRLVGDAVVDVSYPASVDAEVSAQLPQELELHIGGRWEDLSRMQAYDVRTIGSTFVTNKIPEWQLRTRGMHDSFAVWGGVEQRDTGQQIRGGARIGFETSATTPSRTTPLTLAPTSLTLDLGGQARFGSWIAQLTYGFQYYLPVTVDDSAFDPRDYGACIANGNNYESRACRSVRNGYAIAGGDGDYSRMLHTMRLSFRYEFP
ncbi:MAG: hypothetical protein M4D80_05495 [Myxococcota bacterium]|nr:hypothetical protein [Myxococcota bacterium]